MAMPAALRAAHLDSGFVLDQAVDRRGRARIRAEVEGRAWARRHAIPTAEIVAHDPHWSWLISRRVAEEPETSMAYLEAAFDASLRIQSAVEPCSRKHTAWRAPRWTAPIRVGRMLAAGIDPKGFVEARRAASRLPHDAPTHNDFHRGNVLNHVHETGQVAIIDWELMTTGPRHHDMVQLIVDLADSTAAKAAWDLLVSQTSPWEHDALAVQLRWLAIRTYASDVCGPRDDRDADKLRRRRARLREVETWLS